MRAVGIACCPVVAVLGVAVPEVAAQVRTGTPTIHYIDTEVGQSTLFVGPTGESLLVDTGNAGERDLGRIADTLRAAGVTKIDHLWTTHYHGDHVGALLELAKQFRVDAQNVFNRQQWQGPTSDQHAVRPGDERRAQSDAFFHVWRAHTTFYDRAPRR